MGRPKLDIKEEDVLKLAAIHCTMPEMAAVLNCSIDTLENRFSAVIQKGRETGKMSLKRKQYQLAMEGNVTMLIWLGKIMLDQKDTSRIELVNIPDDVFAREAERRLKLVGDT